MSFLSREGDCETCEAESKEEEEEEKQVRFFFLCVFTQTGVAEAIATLEKRQRSMKGSLFPEIVVGAQRHLLAGHSHGSTSSRLFCQWNIFFFFFSFFF